MIFTCYYDKKLYNKDERLKLFLKATSVLLLIICICACAQPADSNNGPSKKPILSNIAITDASNLFIASISSSSRATTTNKLFKITESGYVQEVTIKESYIDDDGNEVESTTTSDYTPTAIYNINSSFVMVGFKYYYDTNYYLVRKTDGSVFTLDNVGHPVDFPQRDNFINSKIIQTDADGNLYYETIISETAGKHKLIKIDTTNVNQLVKTDVTPDTDHIRLFNVTPDGHVAYNYIDINSNSHGSRIKKSNGGVHNLPNPMQTAHWIGLDGKIKYQDRVADASKIVSIIIDQNDYTVSTSETTGSMDYLSNYLSYMFKIDTRTIMISQNSDFVNEVENSSNTPRKVTISEISDIKLADASTDHYYISGNDNSNNPLLIKVDPTDDSVITLLSAGLYDIYKMTVSSDNKVIFNALRMADGVKVIGEINSTGTLRILDESSNSNVVVLEKIK